MLDLKNIGELDDTLIVVTADHGHGFVSMSTLPLFDVELTTSIHRTCLGVLTRSTCRSKIRISARGEQVSQVEVSCMAHF